MIRMRKEYNILLIIFVLALIFRIIFVFVSPIKIWDETVYANLGYDLSRNPFEYSFARGWSDFVPGDWPNAGYRAPLLPYILSAFYLLEIEHFMEFLIPFIGALSVVAFYFLAKKMFNTRVAFYSSMILSFLPLHVYFSGKILTDVFSTFLIILTIMFFWEGFEKGNKKYKFLFGIFLALSILSRYTVAVIIPVFFVYLIIKNKNLSFLKEKYTWLSIILFFIIVSPLFFYSVKTYGSPLGVIDHALRAGSYWGTQSWDFFLDFYVEMFSIIWIVLLLSIAFVCSNKKLMNHSTIFLLLWFFIFFIFVSITPHKEDRFFLSTTPAIAMLSGLFLTSFKKGDFILFFISFLLILSLAEKFSIVYKDSYTQTNECFLAANKFLQNTPNNSVVITDESPIVYYYTKKETHFYPNPFSADSITDLIVIYGERPVYTLISDYDNLKDAAQIKGILDSKFEIVFRCPENGNSSLVYR